MSNRISRIDLGDRRASHGSTAARGGMETGSSALNFATFPISGTTITTCTSSTSSINRQRRQSLLAGVLRQLAPIRQPEVIDENTDNGYEGQLSLRRHRHEGETRLLDRVTSEPRPRLPAKNQSQSTSQENRGGKHVQSASKSRRSSGYRKCTSSDDPPTMSTTTTTRESFEASPPTIKREQFGDRLAAADAQQDVTLVLLKPFLPMQSCSQVPVLHRTATRDPDFCALAASRRSAQWQPLFPRTSLLALPGSCVDTRTDGHYVFDGFGQLVVVR
ncbi:hypothetical protein E4U24_002975 [Claviceps purpurea]|nr:hypothetical protein E4U24_002975 [Claviceps purpurea]